MEQKRWGFAVHTADGVYGYIPVACTDMLIYNSDNKELPVAYSDGKMTVRYAKPHDGEGAANSVWDKLCDNKFKIDNAVRSLLTP